MTKPHVLLALHEDSNANAALFVGGRLVAAVAEQSLTRKRYQAGYPHRAAAECLRLAKLTAADVTEIVAGNRFHVVPRLPFFKPPSWDRSFLGDLHWAYLGYQQSMEQVPLVGGIVENYSRFALRRKTGHTPSLVDHHRAHAASAAFTAGWDRCLAVTMDNFGDGTSASAWSFAHGALAEVSRVGAVDSPGQFYGEIAEILGIHPLLAGKVTGLAARGNADDCMASVRELFSLRPDGSGFVLRTGARFGRGRKAIQALRDHAAGGGKADVAAATQRCLEEVVLAWVTNLLRQTGNTRLALAGGVFGNVRLNQKLAMLPEVEQLWVHPAMSDAGIAAGAAMSVLGARGELRTARMDDAFLGPDFTADECGAALDAAGVKARKVADPDLEAADLVVAGKVVARFTGRLEYGPRALGNRSLLYRTEDPSVNDWLNKRLKRAEYMPFAPATLAEQAPKLYDGLEKATEAARFMTLCFDCTDEMKKLSPAVVHIDGTARPQIVTRDETPGFHRLISRVYEKTGCPSVVNTSFNMHEEPIVRSPEDALRAWQAAELDAMILGPYVVTKN